MKRHYFRNNETDFYKLCRSYVHKALYYVKRFENKNNGLDLILFWDDYCEALEIARQYLVIKSALPIDFQLFLDDYLIQRNVFPYNRETFNTTKEIYHIWQEVCFPQDKSK